MTMYLNKLHEMHSKTILVKTTQLESANKLSLTRALTDLRIINDFFLVKRADARRREASIVKFVYSQTAVDGCQHK
jgi:hypothetical protein